MNTRTLISWVLGITCFAVFVFYAIALGRSEITPSWFTVRTMHIVALAVGFTFIFFQLSVIKKNDLTPNKKKSILFRLVVVGLCVAAVSIVGVVQTPTTPVVIQTQDLAKTADVIALGKSIKAVGEQVSRTHEDIASFEKQYAINHNKTTQELFSIKNDIATASKSNQDRQSVLQESVDTTNSRLGAVALQQQRTHALAEKTEGKIDTLQSGVNQIQDAANQSSMSGIRVHWYLVGGIFAVALILGGLFWGISFLPKIGTLIPQKWARRYIPIALFLVAVVLSFLFATDRVQRSGLLQKEGLIVHSDKSTIMTRKELEKDIKAFVKQSNDSLIKVVTQKEVSVSVSKTNTTKEPKKTKRTAKKTVQGTQTKKQKVRYQPPPYRWG